VKEVDDEVSLVGQGEEMEVETELGGTARPNPWAQHEGGDPVRSEPGVEVVGHGRR
jgi:hypothetical protein